MNFEIFGPSILLIHPLKTINISGTPEQRLTILYIRGKACYEQLAQLCQFAQGQYIFNVSGLPVVSKNTSACWQ